MLPIEQLKNLSDASRQATIRLAEAALEGQEKIVRVNIDAIQEFIKTGGEQIKESCSEMAQVHPLKAWPQAVMGNIQRSTALNLSLIEIIRRMQQELACVVEENLRTLRDGTLDAVEKFASTAKGASPGRRQRDIDGQLKQAA